MFKLRRFCEGLGSLDRSSCKVENAYREAGGRASIGLAGSGGCGLGTLSALARGSGLSQLRVHETCTLRRNKRFL